MHKKSWVVVCVRDWDVLRFIVSIGIRPWRLDTGRKQIFIGSAPTDLVLLLTDDWREVILSLGLTDWTRT